MNFVMRAMFPSLAIPMFASMGCNLASPYKQPNLRPPAVPLVAVDPYFSIWSPSETLTGAATMHWTEAPQRLTSLVRVDGKAFRIMGNEPADIPALPQTALEIMPTTVVYRFEGAGVRVSLSFMTPLLPEDLMIMSRPVTYLTWEVASLDGKEHEVQIHYDNTAELAVQDPAKEEVTWSAEQFAGISALKVGCTNQTPLRARGDRTRINWGFAYVAVADSQKAKTRICPADKARSAWGADIQAPPIPMPATAENSPVLAATFDLGKVSAEPVSRYLVLAYDDVYSAQFFRERLKGYWTKDGDGIAELLTKSMADYDELKSRCAAFDSELMADLNRAAGPKYAWLCALAYRQSLAASKVVVDDSDQPLCFNKENTSNGCMGTVDVFYPQSPLLMLMSPSLIKATLIPVLEYSSSPRWKWSSAPHDVGCWPQANGQVYGGEGDSGMPVEETGNMLLMVAAVAQMDGNVHFAEKYWPTLAKWAQYLEKSGRDPENQLCTDDFAGHLAHNANLAAKSICALGAFGKMAQMKGDAEAAKKYTDLARECAIHWMEQANDGDHFRLAFDKPGTWSCKYNLVWDKILGLNLFPDEAIRKEMAYYRKNIERYGLPLDGRLQNTGGGWNGGEKEREARWSKTDWAFWTACLTENPDDFEAITDPIYQFFNDATRRVGLTDLYFTDASDAARMHSRPVIGGIFIKMLYDKALWQKWASRDRTNANGPWAPLPTPPPMVTVVEPSSTLWRYTTTQPGADWFTKSYDDSAWKQAKGGFGTEGTPNAKIVTVWNTDDIWLRGEITIPEGNYEDLQLSLFHDEDATIYIDGLLAITAPGWNAEYELIPLHGEDWLAPGKKSFAVHCHQTEGGQFIDFGIVDVKKPKGKATK